MNLQQKQYLEDDAATAALGASLAELWAPRAGGVIYLQGSLGAGKTTLARGLLRAAGVEGTLRSPTYTLMEPYETQGRAFLHLDLYRLADPAEVDFLGLFDYPPEQTLWLVEWPEKGAGYLPPADLCVSLEQESGGRLARLTGL